MIFNRPEPTRAVFSSIRAARPEKLYIAADGPRGDRPGEADSCSQTRQIANEVDWPCEVKTLFRDRNLGPMHAQIAAIDWFFSHEDAGIVLEDDCLPSQSFFSFCEELLERYRDDGRVFMISGDNFQDGLVRGDGDYYFSVYAHTWGWATWRRSWTKLDKDLRGWPESREMGLIEGLHARRRTRRYWRQLFDKIHRGEYRRGWDYRWLYSCWKENGLVVTPNKNLVSNIGFGPSGTNCRNEDSSLAKRPAFELEAPLRHPSVMARHFLADEKVSRDLFSHRSFVQKLMNAVRRPRLAIREIADRMRPSLRESQSSTHS